MTTIAAGEFKARCLQMLDEVKSSREPLVVTKFGKPVAKVVPMPPALPLRGALKGSVLFEADIISPLETEWEAAQE